MRYSIHTDKQKKQSFWKSLRSKITFILKRALVCVRMKYEASESIRAKIFMYSRILIAAELVQSVERLTAERVVAGTIPGTGLILGVLK